MRRGEHKEVNGFFVRKEGHPILRTRDGYAKACYAIYETNEQMREGRPIGRCLTMADVRAVTKEETPCC